MAESSRTRSDHHDNNDNYENPDTSHAQFNQDNPLHLQSSDSPGMKLVSEAFDGTDFSNWKRSMTIALSARNKLGFVDGTIPRPVTTSPSFKSWSRCNDMERYGVSSGAQLFGLHKELAEVNQGNSNIADYFTKMKMLWDDIDALCLIPVCSCGCSCGASQKLSKFQQDQRIIQFLMGLNETYNVIKGSILMRSPLPSIGQVYSLLLQEETQREIHTTGQFVPDSASLNVSQPYGNNVYISGGNNGKRPQFDTKKVHSLRKPLAIGDSQRGLYMLQSDTPSIPAVTHSSSNASFIKNSAILWHTRLGHLPVSKLKTICNIDSNSIYVISACDICAKVR
ncbi:uncharacterized protein LOC141665669 [Apium graveolens]|uniref:uncharacterized protein LOC141665669 n=1 Tax=Apium graveolens TaxID=4045 RepID=UPI003D7915E3